MRAIRLDERPDDWQPQPSADLPGVTDSGATFSLDTSAFERALIACTAAFEEAASALGRAYLPVSVYVETDPEPVASFPAFTMVLK